jgi:hypothetical protein
VEYTLYRSLDDELGDDDDDLLSYVVKSTFPAKARLVGAVCAAVHVRVMGRVIGPSGCCDSRDDLIEVSRCAPNGLECGGVERIEGGHVLALSHPDFLTGNYPGRGSRQLMRATLFFTPSRIFEASAQYYSRHKVTLSIVPRLS